ncbi:hypothetical protein NDU88_005810 [Pleurodeles waltl]|uniref:Uncharacterized protein n=1 Tax=Pleurodeles waltl TaxID=8319 RepID=A0AAV7TC60_PLEWA|nr:hypothetical protein NDU88_005810 [Pleurodeles waltl]
MKRCSAAACSPAVDILNQAPAKYLYLALEHMREEEDTHVAGENNPSRTPGLSEVLPGTDEDRDGASGAGTELRA